MKHDHRTSTLKPRPSRAATLSQSLLVLFAAMCVATAASPAIADEVSTRFGRVSAGTDNVLLFRGRPVQPRIEGKASLSILDVFHIGPADAVVVRDNGGSGCPALYHVLTATSDGIKGTGPVGTCNDLTQISSDGRAILLAMPGWQGPAEPQAARIRAFRERHLFRVVGDAITDNGRPVRQ